MIKDVVIIGGGPAGITAGIYARRAGLSVLLCAEKLGGQLMNTKKIDNYPGFESILGSELSDKMISHLKSLLLDNEIVKTKVESIGYQENMFITKTFDNMTYFSKTVILAFGKEYRKLDVPGEIELAGSGVSYCAICDGFFFKGEDVVVVGGGNSALSEALYLEEFCKSIVLINKNESFKGEQILIDRVLNKPNIKVLYSAKTIKILGEDTVTGIQFIDNNNQIQTLQCSGIFVKIGSYVNLSLLSHLKPELSKFGEILTDDDMHTNIPGVFACGDIVHSHFKQAILSAAQGCIAALSAKEFITYKN